MVVFYAFPLTLDQFLRDGVRSCDARDEDVLFLLLVFFGFVLCALLLVLLVLLALLWLEVLDFLAGYILFLLFVVILRFLLLLPLSLTLVVQLQSHAPLLLHHFLVSLGGHASVAGMDLSFPFGWREGLGIFGLHLLLLGYFLLLSD